MLKNFLLSTLVFLKISKNFAFRLLLFLKSRKTSRFAFRGFKIFNDFRLLPFDLKISKWTTLIYTVPNNQKVVLVSHDRVVYFAFDNKANKVSTLTIATIDLSNNFDL